MFEKIGKGEPIKGWFLPWVNDDGSIQTPIGAFNINPKSWIARKIEIDEKYKECYNVKSMANYYLNTRSEPNMIEDEKRLLAMKKSIHHSHYYSNGGHPYRLDNFPFEYLMRDIPMPYTQYFSQGGLIFEIKYNEKDMFFHRDDTYYREKWSRCKNEWGGRLYCNDLQATSSIRDAKNSTANVIQKRDDMEMLIEMATSQSTFLIELPNKTFLICASANGTEYAMAIGFSAKTLARFTTMNASDVIYNDTTAWFTPVPIYRSFFNNRRANMNQIPSIFRANKLNREKVENISDFVEEYISWAKDWREKEWLITFTKKGDKLSQVIGRGQKLIEDYAARHRHVIRHSKYEITVSYEFVPGNLIPGLDAKQTKAWKKLHKGERFVLVFEIAGRKRKPTMAWHIYRISSDKSFYRVENSAICVDSDANNNEIYIEEDHIASRMLLVMSPKNSCVDESGIWTMPNAWRDAYHNVFRVSPKPLENAQAIIKPYTGRLLKKIGADALSKSRPWGYKPDKDFDLNEQLRKAKMGE